MPTYEYACDNCGHRFEEFQGINDAPIEICPVCNAKVHRVINGGAGLIFKGSGFYITDYKHAHSSGGNGKHPKPHNISGDNKTPGDKDKPKSDSSKE